VLLSVTANDQGLPHRGVCRGWY